jgi:hypothetical protein
MSEGRKSFQSQQDDESFSQRTQFDSILQNQRHVELLAAVKKLTSSINLLQRSHDELRVHVDRRFENVHQHIREMKQSIISTPRKVENSPPTSDDTERETMTVDDYLRRRKRQRNEQHDDSSSEVLVPVAKSTTSWTYEGSERVQSSMSFFDDIFREDELCMARKNTENRPTMHGKHSAIPFRHAESTVSRNTSSIRWGSGRGQYRATNSVTCESAVEYVGDNSSNGSYSAMTDDFSLH